MDEIALDGGRALVLIVERRVIVGSVGWTDYYKDLGLVSGGPPSLHIGSIIIAYGPVSFGEILQTRDDRAKQFTLCQVTPHTHGTGWV